MFLANFEAMEKNEIIIPDTYRSISGESEGLFKDNGSRFIAKAYPVESEEEVKVIVGSLKKEYHDARLSNRGVDTYDSFCLANPYRCLIREGKVGTDELDEKARRVLRLIFRTTMSKDRPWGPVANDRVYAQFALFESRLIDKQTLIRELKTYTLVDQLLFHTPQALESLSFVDFRRIAL